MDTEVFMRFDNIKPCVIISETEIIVVEYIGYKHYFSIN